MTKTERTAAVATQLANHLSYRLGGATHTALDALHACEWKKRADAAEKANADWAAWLASELGKP